MASVEAGGHRLEVERIDVGARERPALVFLHEGLGSVAMWRDFPARVAHACGCNAIVYSRYGYGESDPRARDHTVAYMHDEALKTLPELLDRLDVQRPILVGHSDGASIALIHAADSGRALTAVVAMAPHVFVEDVSISSIEAAKVAYETTDLRAKLARYHRDVDSAFWGWNRIWLHPDFRAWNIEALLPRIACPVLAIQGEDDEYGTMAQVQSIRRHVRDVDVVALSDCRHSPQRDQPQATQDAITAFVDRVTAG
jgi:pimeloyl-ACP methyl ester carboxylesterase